MTATYFFTWQPLRAMMLGFRWLHTPSVTIDDMPFDLPPDERFAPWQAYLHIGLPFMAFGIEFEGCNPYVRCTHSHHPKP